MRSSGFRSGGDEAPGKVVHIESLFCDREDPGAARGWAAPFSFSGAGIGFPAPRLLVLAALCGCQGASGREPREPDAGFSERKQVKPDSFRLNLPRKEVIQPHLPVRLPCYDFTPLTLHTFDASAP